METDLFSQGVTLMLAGMGTVFAFLTVLVLVMTLMSTVINRMQKPDLAADVSADEVAAISAAIDRFRRSK
jgi:oxaloacetate decarboxylase gamma subunit